MRDDLGAFRSAQEDPPTKPEGPNTDCATSVIPPFPYQEFEAWLVTTLTTGKIFNNGGDVEKGSCA